MDSKQRYYLRALAVVGGVLLAFSMFLSPFYALPGLGAAAIIVFADMLNPGRYRSAVLVGMISAMVAAIVAFLYFQYLWGIPGCVLLMAAATWSLMRLHESSNKPPRGYADDDA